MTRSALLPVVVMLAVVVTLSGCPSWRTVPVSAIDNDHAMVFTDRTVYELAETQLHGSQVVGTMMRAWHITTCTYDANEPPGDIARHCRWPVEPTPTTPDGRATVLALERTAVRNVHVRQTNERELLIVTTALLVTVAVFIGGIRYAKLSADD